ncbi:MAG: uncharacterized protein JWO36_3564 [Myxococcales bacterium]|nr:uncharacterized protein [Myxococcales bacterium]
MGARRLERSLLLCFLHLACGSNASTPAPCLDAGSGRGEATYYDADGTGACSFDATGDKLVAAMNGTDYARAAWCGACLDVSGPQGHVIVRVVDSCPGCKVGSLDLSREAFAKIAPLDAGRVLITWRSVACEVAGPLAYHFKDGSNPFWTGIQVREHRYPIAKLEAWDALGQLHEIKRADYNYFVANGLGPGPYAFRVTDTRGHAHVDAFVPLSPEHTLPGAVQFPTCP